MSDNLILGCDIGFATNAIAILDEQKNIIYTEFMKTDSSDTLVNRFYFLYNRFLDVLEEFKVSKIIYEHPVMHNKQGHLLSGVAALLFVAARVRDIEFIQDYSATHIKKVLTNNGHASKAEVKHAVLKQVVFDKKYNNHVVDAIACVLVYLMENPPSSCKTPTKALPLPHLHNLSA
jgi:Holliday junction resolvasome RuvABC endonuclease subunit